MYRFVDHTAELELELEADSAEGVLEEALRAFAELVEDEDAPRAGEAVERDVDVAAADLPGLLAAWLDELLFLADAEQLVPESADVSITESRAKGVVRARRSEPRPLVKAITLHRLRFRAENGVWRARVVLDV
jgi:SHS2 domain-containing protein